MEQEKNNKGIIILLVIIILFLVVLCTLFATGTLSFQNDSIITNNTNNTNNNSTNESSDINNDNINDTSNNEITNNEDTNIVVNNKTIDKYIGKWLLANQDYSYINIKKDDNNSSYKIDILINKEADYKDLELNCADNSGACYFSGDTSHNYSIMMANDIVIILPDYGTAGYWTFNK